MKKINWIILITVLFLSFLFITSCSNKVNNICFNDDINIYESQETILSDVLFSVKDDNTILENNVLKISFTYLITNNTKDNIKLSIKNPIAYGNDELLREEVLESFDKDNKDLNIVFSDKEIIINKKKTEEVMFYLIIQDGNQDAKYRIDFELNNVITSIYSYGEGYTVDKFIYVHNPLLCDKVLVDAVYDESTVFGFKPSEEGSLKGYASYDWTNIETVFEYKKARIEYTDDNDKRIYDLELSLRKEKKAWKKSLEHVQHLEMKSDLRHIKIILKDLKLSSKEI